MPPAEDAVGISRGKGAQSADATDSRPAQTRCSAVEKRARLAAGSSGAVASKQADFQVDRAPVGSSLLSKCLTAERGHRARDLAAHGRRRVGHLDQPENPQGSKGGLFEIARPLAEDRIDRNFLRWRTSDSPRAWRCTRSSRRSAGIAQPKSIECHRRKSLDEIVRIGRINRAFQPPRRAAQSLLHDFDWQNAGGQRPPGSADDLSRENQFHHVRKN
jgi:hypothetical protein